MQVASRSPAGTSQVGNRYIGGREQVENRYIGGREQVENRYIGGRMQVQTIYKHTVSTTPAPTTACRHTADGSGTGPFVSHLPPPSRRVPPTTTEPTPPGCKNKHKKKESNLPTHLSDEPNICSHIKKYLFFHSPGGKFGWHVIGTKEVFYSTVLI